LLIVFSTFVAKEVIRENPKDKIADISSAQNTYLIRAESAQQTLRLCRTLVFRIAAEFGDWSST
jgi:hypothetical protein